MRSIRPPRPDRPGLDSRDLERLAQEMSNRVFLHCHACKGWLRLRVEARELRFGSSPDLASLDPSQPGRPRLVFWCSHCQTMIGYVQGEEWAPLLDTPGEDEPTRWGHLELDESEDVPG